MSDDPENEHGDETKSETGVEEVVKKEDEGAEVAEESKADDDGAEVRRKSKTKDDSAAEETSKVDDDGAETRRKSKAEDDDAEARRKSKADDDVAEARRKSKVEEETKEKTAITPDMNAPCTCPKPPPARPKLYLSEPSAPVRSVLITAAAIGLELDKHEIDLMKGEHLTQEFLQLNPQHTVPTLVDGDYVLWDSHAINPYLVGKYAEDSPLYPKDLQKRGIVDNRLHYNNSTIFNAYKHTMTYVLMKGAPITADHVKSLEEIYALLNTLLKKTKYIAGDDVTIADFSIIPHITTVEIVLPIDQDKFPKLIEWERRVKELPCYAANEPGLRKFEETIKAKLNK